MRLPERTVALELSTADAGVAVDCLCITNDPDFRPGGRGREPNAELTTPADLRVEGFTMADADRLDVADGHVKIAWLPSTAPQGVTRYQVYRGEAADFAAGPEHLLGSPVQPLFYDCDLEVGRRVFYRVRAMDAWGNVSAASAALPVTVGPAALRPAFQYRRQTADSLKTVIAFDAGESRCTNGTISRWQWEFGDGATGEGPTVTHAYAKPGCYAVTLRLVTDRGAGARLRKAIQINPVWVDRGRSTQRRRRRHQPHLQRSHQRLRSRRDILGQGPRTLARVDHPRRQG
jgi:hypothetical protein